MFGFLLTLFGILIIGVYFLTNAYRALKGESTTFTQTTINNNLNGDYTIANISNPDNDYNFEANIHIHTWEGIDPADLIDIYQVTRTPSSGINMQKLERYVLPVLSI